MAKNRIVLTAEADLKDHEVRDAVQKLNYTIENINKRTKKHTLEIKDLEKKLQEANKIVLQFAKSLKEPKE